MGTSKGYIPPTRIEWTQAKRAVTQLVNNRDAQSVANAASKFASAMKADTRDGTTFTHAVAGILSLAKSISGHGVDNALREINRQDLLEKNSDEIWNDLLQQYTTNGATAEDSLAIDALSLALQNLKIDNLEKLGLVSQEVLLKEMLIDYISLNFEFRYAEKIGKDRSPSDAHHIIELIQKYIRSNLYENLTFQDIQAIDFNQLSGDAYVESALSSAFTLFEQLYTED